MSLYRIIVFPTILNFFKKASQHILSKIDSMEVLNGLSKWYLFI